MGVGACMFLLHRLPEKGGDCSKFVGPGRGEERMVSPWVGGSWWCSGWGGMKFLVCRVPEEAQLCVTSYLALSKLLFLLEPPVSFSANGGADCCCGEVVRIK